MAAIQLCPGWRRISFPEAPPACSPQCSPFLLGAPPRLLVYCRHTLASVALDSHQFPGQVCGCTQTSLSQGQAGVRAWGESQETFPEEELSLGGCRDVGAGQLQLTLWNGCAICLRKYLATWTPSSTVRLRLASVRCSWIQRGSFPRLSTPAYRFEQERGRERKGVGTLGWGLGPPGQWGNSQVGRAPEPAPCQRRP